jgi:hypothetical protein
MYFPFLRGKQFELLALKDICPLLKPLNKVHPIIEPVKESFQALERSLTEICCNDILPTVIVNPSVGDMEGTSASKLNLFVSKFSESNQVNVGFIINNDAGFAKADNIMKKFYDDNAPITLVFNQEAEITTAVVKSFISDYNVVYNVIDDSNTRGFKRIFAPETKVTLNDPFPKAEKNADYAKKHDALLTEEHVFFSDDGYVGFSDYLTIGRNYKDSGFLPYAVAIHITYAAKGNQEIRLRHFVSDSNDDDSNVAGKFFEALSKLVEFTATLPFKTQALSEFEILYKKEHYPGLGYIKKLSILNHLELVNKLLQ